MPVEKSILQKLQRYAQVFREARERNANESDTVMYLIKFFEDVLGYDSLVGEISKEVAIKDRYCDFGIKLDGSFRFLVEVKAISKTNLREKDIEQAENYASRSGIKWVLLTNGADWRLYHLTFEEGSGIVHDVAFELNLCDRLQEDPDSVWNSLKLLRKENILKGGLDDYWTQRKTLAPSSLVRVLFSEPVLREVRKELRRNTSVMLEIKDVFSAIKDLLSKDALLEAGEISLPRRKRRRRKIKQTDASGQVHEVEVEEDDDEMESAANLNKNGDTTPKATAIPTP